MFVFLVEKSMWIIFTCFSDSYPMLLVANKVDLVHLRKVTEEQGKELAFALKVNIFLFYNQNILYIHLNQQFVQWLGSANVPYKSRPTFVWV